MRARLQAYEDRRRSEIELASMFVSADATVAHQSVINVMDAARRANLPKLTFATQTSSGAEAR